MSQISIEHIIQFAINIFINLNTNFKVFLSKEKDIYLCVYENMQNSYVLYPIPIYSIHDKSETRTKNVHNNKRFTLQTFLQLLQNKTGDFSFFTQHTLRCLKVFEKIQYFQTFQIQIKIKNLLITCFDTFGSNLFRKRKYLSNLFANV